MTRYLILSLISLIAFTGCGRPDDVPDDSAAQPTVAKKDETSADAKPNVDAPPTKPPTLAKPTTAEREPDERQTCAPPKSVANDPQTISQAIDLINALPAPVTTSCLLEVLKRPLHFNATLSTTSVQPAANERYPRIFIFSGPSLIITFVPAGKGSDVIEFSQLINNTLSVKAEVSMPVASDLATNAGYERILKNGGGGTTCSACHGQESPAPPAFGPNAFQSRAFRPVPNKDLPLIDFKLYADGCEGNKTSACDVVRAILDHGDVLPQAFPPDMPILF